MSFDSFEEVRGIGEDRLRLLVTSGDGAERVWAAWALAEDAVASAGAALGERVDVERDPGVRAHYVGILAGLGFSSIVRVLMAEDPDPFVRATACDYLVRITGPDQIEESRTLLTDRLQAESETGPVTRILDVYPADWPPLDPSLLTALLQRAEPAVRSAAACCALRTYPTGEFRREFLEACLGNTESDVAVLERVADEAIACGAPELVTIAAKRVPAARRQLLEALASTGLRIPWSQLSEIALDADPRVRLLVIRLSESWESDAALRWLADTAQFRFAGAPFVPYPSSGTADWSDSAWKVPTLARQQLLEALQRIDRPLGAEASSSIQPLLEIVSQSIDWLTEAELWEIEDEGLEREPELAQARKDSQILSNALGRPAV